MNSMTITLLILLAVIIALVSGKVPFSLVGVLVMLSLVIFKVLPIQRAFAGLINNSVILFAAMFVISAGLQKTTLIPKAAEFVERFKDRPKLLTLFTCIIGSLLAIVSNGSIALVIMLPILCGICDDINLSRSKLLYPFYVSAISSAGAWFLGVGAMNLSWSSVMLKLGAKNPININDFLVARLPFLIVIILYMTFIAPKFLPNHDNKELAKNSPAFSKTSNEPQLSHTKNILGIVICVATIVLMILATYIHLETYQIATIGAVLLVVCGILKNKEALNSINLNIILMIAGMLGLADALQASGAGDVIGNVMANVIKNIDNPFAMMGLFFLVSLILTQFLGGVTVSILVPLWTLVCVKLGIDPRGAVLAAATANAFNFLTPIGSHSLPLIMETGGYKINDFLKVGLPLLLILAFMGIFVTQFMYPL